MHYNTPIAIFCYRRSISQLINSLLQNDEATCTDLYIFSDGGKNDHDSADIQQVREELDAIEGFKSVTVNKASANQGLARSIIKGVTSVLAGHDRVIVLEDDLLVAPYFLRFMNDALEFYQNNDRIWSISGYSPPLPALASYKDTCYLSPRGSSWGWATWKNRWELVDWSMHDFNDLKNNKDQVAAFNKSGNDMFLMLELQALGKIDSWAIRWYHSQFKHHAFSLVPRQTLILNEGFEDGKGVHNNYTTTQKLARDLYMQPVSVSDIEVDKKILNDWKNFHDLTIYTRLGYALRKYGGYKLAKKLIRFFRS